MNTKAVIEAIKELGRYLLFATIALAATGLTETVATGDPTSVEVILGTLVLRFIDKYVHESDINLKGISPF